jgi:glycosyltransferase involved in cell wall biosynthesis
LGIGRILAYLKTHDIQVIHCHKSSDLSLGALLATLRPRLRLFFTDHMGVTRPKKDVYHRWTYGRVSALFSISKATRARNIEAFPLPPEKIHLLYLGIDPEPYASRLDDEGRYALRHQLGIPDSVVAIGLPGRLTQGKGQQLWIEALARLRELPLRSSWHAVFIGGLTAQEGSNETFVRELRQRIVELGLDESITFSGFRSDMPRCLEVINIVCIPSRNEAFGLTVIEAMAAGKAVIGSDSGAIPELIDEATGCLARHDDAAAWTSRMAILIDDEGLREILGSEAKRKAKKDFSLENHVAKLTSFYENMAK